MSGFEEVNEIIPRDRFSRPMIIPPGGGKLIPYTTATSGASRTEVVWVNRPPLGGLW